MIFTIENSTQTIDGLWSLMSDLPNGNYKESLMAYLVDMPAYGKTEKIVKFPAIIGTDSLETNLYNELAEREAELDRLAEEEYYFG